MDTSAAPETRPDQAPTETEGHELGRLESTLMRFGTFGELLMLVAAGGRWWMLPLVLLLVVLGIGLVALQSVQYLAPFIYMVF